MKCYCKGNKTCYSLSDNIWVIRICPKMNKEHILIEKGENITLHRPLYSSKKEKLNENGNPQKIHITSGAAKIMKKLLDF